MVVVVVVAKCTHMGIVVVAMMCCDFSFIWICVYCVVFLSLSSHSHSPPPSHTNKNTHLSPPPTTPTQASLQPLRTLEQSIVAAMAEGLWVTTVLPAALEVDVEEVFHGKKQTPVCVWGGVGGQRGVLVCLCLCGGVCVCWGVV